MITTLNPIEAVKHAAAAIIQAEEYFKNVPVVVDDKGDVDTQIDVALQQTGLGIVIECIEGKVLYQAVGSSAVELQPTLTITENVLINRDPSNTSASGKTASDVLCNLLALFNPLTASAAGRELPLYMSSWDLLSNMGSTIIYQIKCRANAGWKA